MEKGAKDFRAGEIEQKVRNFREFIKTPEGIQAKKKTGEMIKDRIRFKKILLEQRTDFEKQLVRIYQRQAIGWLDQSTEKNPFLSNHTADIDTSTTTILRIDEKRIANLEKCLRQCDQALFRIREGNFGKCMRCGEKISLQRLEIVPFAKYCVKCKSKSP